MHRCSKCDEPVDEERIKFYLNTTNQLPEFCVKCQPNAPVIGFMVEGCPEEGGSPKGTRKSSSLLVIDSTKFADPKEAMRKAIRAHTRARSGSTPEKL